MLNFFRVAASRKQLKDIFKIRGKEDRNTAPKCRVFYDFQPGISDLSLITGLVNTKAPSSNYYNKI
jgi:hypothetical protein